VRSSRPTYAVSWSGGKDSTLALDRALRMGLRVRHLFNLYDEPSGRVAFHGVRAELIRMQAKRLGLGILQLPVRPGEFEPVFLAGLERLRVLGVTGIIFGNIHLADVRAWYEERTTAVGFEHVEPLWAEPPDDLVREFLARGYRTLLASVNLELGRREWVGRELTSALATEVAGTPGVDAAGERGEYHTFVFEGPLFASRIEVVPGDVIEYKGHALIELTKPETPT
jgi:diphthine-ammonia ligase